MIYSMLEVSKNTFDNNPVTATGFVHELTDLVDIHRNVRSCERQILERSDNASVLGGVIIGRPIKLG